MRRTEVRTICTQTNMDSETLEDARPFLDTVGKTQVTLVGVRHLVAKPC